MCVRKATKLIFDTWRPMDSELNFTRGTCQGSLIWAQNKAPKYVLLQECARHVTGGPAELLVRVGRSFAVGYALTPPLPPQGRDDTSARPLLGADQLQD